MKIAVMIVRILLGLIFVLSSLGFFLGLMPESEGNGDTQRFMEGLDASGYVMPVVKVIELLCGIAFLAGRFVPLATVVIFPIVLNILLFHMLLDPAGLPVALSLILGNLFLAYACRRHYQPIFEPKIDPFQK